MSSNPDSVESGKPFSASRGSTGASSKAPQAGWESSASELKHQPGRDTAPQNTVEILPKGTHLPPDRTFLPQNLERNVPAETRQDGVGTGLTNAELRQTMGGATSGTVHQGLGMPGDQSENEKGSGGLARHGKGGLQESAGPAYEPGKD
jgi:hypothetical protein